GVPGASTVTMWGPESRSRKRKRADRGGRSETRCPGQRSGVDFREKRSLLPAGTGGEWVGPGGFLMASGEGEAMRSAEMGVARSRVLSTLLFWVVGPLVALGTTAAR